MKILVVSQYYYPENFQITPICEELVKRGHDVTVLTGQPNYPIGKIFKGYEKVKDEEIQGVHVKRVKLIPRKKGPIFLALNYVSFVINANKKIFSIKGKFDFVFVYQLSPVLMGIPALKYSKKQNIPMITYCCDLWPESLKMYIQNEDNFIFKKIKKISKKIYSSSKKVICQSTSFIEYMKSVHEISDDQLLYLPAFADEKYLKISYRNSHTGTNFVFLGNLGIAQNLLDILKSIKLVNQEIDFKFHFVGDGTCLDEMKQYVISNNLSDRVVFYGRRPVEEMEKFYELADICVVSLKADNLTGLTLPSKVQGYMAAGKPIIGMIEGSAAKVIAEANCGKCVASNDIQGFSNLIVDAVINLNAYKILGNNGREFFKENFRKDVFISKLENVFDSIKEN